MLPVFAILLTILFFPTVRSYAGSHGIDSYFYSFVLWLLSLVRAGVLILALRNAFRGKQLALALAAVIVIELSSLAFHFIAALFDERPNCYGAFELIATLLPAILIVYTFRPAPSIALAGSILAALIAIGGVAGYTVLTRADAAKAAAFDQSERQRHAARLAQLEAAPDSALIDFLLPGEFGDISSAAIKRITQLPDGLEQLQATGRFAEIDPNDRRFITEHFEAKRAAPKAPTKLDAIVETAKLPRATTDVKVFEKALFAAVDLAVEYCQRIEAGDPPSIDDINTLDSTTATLIIRVDYKRPDIAKALDKLGKFYPGSRLTAPK